MNLKTSQKDRIVDDGKLKRMKQTMKNYENTLENHENQPKILKTKTSKSTFNDNNRISSDGNVCPSSSNGKDANSKDQRNATFDIILCFFKISISV